ncbi:MAG: chaperone NapD [Ectothiorhodospiraceae bacterium]|nr:chaperone NapD [Ectothiorhodospiraceae bacterium]
MNICGVLVHARAEQAAEVARDLALMPGVEVHAREGGRLVVTVEETPDAPRAADSLSAMHSVRGVLAASLVYHVCDPDCERGEDPS